VPDTPPGTYSVLVSSPRVQYTETPDGVKHIYTSGDETANGDGADTEKTPQAALAVKASNDIAQTMINHSTESFYVRGN
jgi:hypothetical protein